MTTHKEPGGKAVVDRVLWVCLVIALIAMGLFFAKRGIARSFPQADGTFRGTDFDHFFWAAQAMLKGENIYASGTQGYLYPPLIAWMVSPLTHLGEPGALRVWMVSNLVLLSASLVLLGREMARRLKVKPEVMLICAVSVLTLAANLDQIRWEFELAQCDTIVLLGFTLGLVWLDKRPGLAGLALGLAFNVKYQTLVVLPYLLARRRFKAAGSMVASAVGFLLLPAVTQGLHENLRSIQIAFGGLLNHIGLGPGEGVARAANVYPITYDRSVSVSSALARLLEVTDHPERMMMFCAAALGVGLVLLGIAWVIYRRAGVPMFVGRSPETDQRGAMPAVVALEWVGLIVAVLAFSPQTLARHTFLMVPVHVLAFTILCRPRRGVEVWWLLAGVVLFTLGVTLPPGGDFGSGRALAHWRAIGGTSWCMLAFYFALVWTTLRYARATAGIAEKVAPGVDERVLA